MKLSFGSISKHVLQTVFGTNTMSEAIQTTLLCTKLVVVASEGSKTSHNALADEVGAAVSLTMTRMIAMMTTIAQEVVEHGNQAVHETPSELRVESLRKAKSFHSQNGS